MRKVRLLAPPLFFWMVVFHASFLGKPALAAEIESVKIRSYYNETWAIESDPFDESYSIELRIGGYYRDLEPFPEENIRQLESALKEPPVEEWDLQWFGVDADWLKKTRDEALAKYQQDQCKSKCLTAEQIEWYSAAIENPEFISSLLNHFKEALGSQKYDSSLLDVQVVMDNGDLIELKASFPGFWLLPWEVNASGEKYRTFNPALSHAVSALLPKKDMNQFRLSPTVLEYYVRRTMSHIFRYWNRFPKYG